MNVEEQGNERLTLTEHCLAAIKEGQVTCDPILSALIGVADLEGVTFGLRLTLVIDGLVVSGQIGGSEGFAQRLDNGIRDAMLHLAAEHAGTPEGEVAESFKDGMQGIFVSRTDAARRAERDVMESYNAWAAEQGIEDFSKADLHEMPRDLALKLIGDQALIDAFTLNNAVIEGGLGARTEIGTMRVRTSSVSAWWTGLGSPDAPAPADG